jgi:hypothetical protein
MRRMNRPYRRRRICIAMLGTLVLAACGHKTEAPPSAAGTAQPQTGSAPWAGKPLHGNDAASLRAHLENVKEIKPKKFDVHWSPAVIAFDKAAHYAR